MRSLIPWLLLPLCLVAGVLAAVPWLQAYGSGVAVVPVLGAAVLSPLVPAAAARARVRAVWLSLLIDVGAFAVYTLAVVLHDPLGVPDIVRGLVRGPSQILTFALPLVSPRTLLVAPVALVWLAGTIAGECFTRRWFTVLPYPAFLVSYALAYAASARAHRTGLVREAVLAAALLLALLLLRVVQTWVRQDQTAESTQADGILPLRGAVVGAATAVVVTLVASLSVQSGAFTGAARAPQRVPPIDTTQPLSPVDFVAALRPRTPGAAAEPVFTVTLDRPAPGYFSLADLDTYDGAGWSFERTFRPSGGVVPDDADPELQHSGGTVLQQYRIDAGPLAGEPWMPYLNRPVRVSGLGVNVDADSGMVVPASAAGAGSEYSVSSLTADRSFGSLPATAVPDTGTAAQNAAIPVTTSQRLTDLVDAFSAEVGVPTARHIAFLQALAQDLRTHYGLTEAAGSGAAPSSTPSPSASSSPSPSPSASPSSPTGATQARAGSTAYSAVLSSIGQDRVGSPEQYATLVALVARYLGVPARVATGFRVVPPDSSGLLAKDTYQVTTADAWTWVEVPIVGVGWVVLDAAPSIHGTGRQRPSAVAGASQTPSPTPTQNAQLTKGNGGNAVAPRSTVPRSHTSAPVTLMVVVVLIAAALLVALLAVLLLRKGRRRRRRLHAADPRARVVGAWLESIDMLTEAGLPPLTTMTGEEIAALTGEQFGPDPGGAAGFIGRTAGAAIYSTALLVRPEDADAAWAAQRQLRRQVNRRLGVGGRLRAWLRYTRVRRGTGRG
ncbi:MAG: hypothetical protein EPN43_11370 [Jatrophihabitans sp.]|nr:MAG: hypothetical protein EPN43_11370 [Jatrophihabitans sp.]